MKKDTLRILLTLLVVMTVLVGLTTITASAAEGDVYTVVGDAGLCGSGWDTGDSYNDMTYNEKTGLYERTFTGISAGYYECKVILNHDYSNGEWGGTAGTYGNNYAITTTEEQDITITFDPLYEQIGHRLSESTGPDENRPSTDVQGPDLSEYETIRIYLADTANWGNANFYCWTEGASDQNGAWPGLPMTWDGEKQLYYADVSVYYQNIIFNYGGTQTADLTVPGDGAIFDNTTLEWTDLGNYTPAPEPEDTTEDVTVYVKDDAGWGGVYIYFWNVAGIEASAFPGVAMELGEDGYYTYTIPAGFCSVIFSNGGSWEDGSLNQSSDLIIPIDGKTYISNTNEEWYSIGGNDNTPDQPGESPDDSDNGSDGNDEPAKMTFIQKVAKAILLFLRGIQDFFKGIFKK